MPEQRIKDADGNEYYSPDGSSFQPIERIKDADGNEFENLGGTWKPVQTQPDILSMQPKDEVDPLTLRGRQKVQRIETSKALLGGDETSRLQQDYFKVPTAPPVESPAPYRPSVDYAKEMIQGSSVKPYAQMSLDERLSEQGLKPTGNRVTDLKRLEKVERKNAKMATLASRTMIPAGPGYIPVVSEEAGLSVGQGVLNLARLPLSMMELAGALERRVSRAFGIPDEVTDNNLVSRMAKGAEAMAGKIRGAEQAAAKLQMPTAPESVVDPDTGERVGIDMATRVLDPWKVIQTTGAEAAPMALNLVSGGTVSIPVAVARSIQGEMDDVADFYSERYGVDRQDAIAANVYSVTGSGATQGTVAGLFDMFQVGKMLEAPGKSLAGKALRAVAIGASEGPSEYTENLISGGVKRATYNPELTWKQIEDQAREGAILGMFSSGIFGAGSQVRGGEVETAAAEPAAPVMEEPAAPEDPVTATRKWIAELRLEVADLNQQITEAPVKYKKGKKASNFTLEQLAEMGRLQDEAKRKQELADLLTGQLAEMQGQVPGDQQSEQIRNEIRRLEIEANEIMGRVGSMREGTKRDAAGVRVQENAPARLRNAQIAMLEGVLDGSVNQDQLGFIAAPLVSVSPEIAADLAELSAAVKMAGVTDFDRELSYLDAEANLAALNGQPVDSLFEKRINEELRPKIAAAIKDISPEFSVDGVKYVAPKGDIATRLKEAKRIHDEKQAKVRAQKNKSKAAKAAEHAKIGEEYTEAKRQIAGMVEADKNQKEEAVLEELATNDPAFGEVKQSISNLLFDSGYTPEEVDTISDINSRIIYNLARREGLDPVALLDRYGITVSRYGFTEEGMPSAMNVTYTQPDHDTRFGSKQWNERLFGEYGKGKRNVSDRAARMLAGGDVLFQPAYHGSPYRFDRFSLEHMGKGEGAQAYGWGLYFAGSKDVAEWYRAKLTAKDAEVIFTGKSGLKQTIGQNGREGIAAKFIAAFDGDIDAALDELRRGAIVFTNDDSMRQAYDWLVRNRDRLEYRQKSTGQTYKVEIPDDGSYLLWDKSLSDQDVSLAPAINRIKNMLASEIDEYLDRLNADWEEITGRELYMILKRAIVDDVLQPNGDDVETAVEMGEDAKAVSLFLKNEGFPGIKYLDGASRGRSGGSFNYVVFDDSAVKILETYYQDTTKKNQQAFDNTRADESRTEQEDFAAFNRELAGILPNRGFIQIGKDRKVHIGLLEDMDLSTFFHEFGGHLTLEMMGDLASSPNASPGLKTDYAQVLKFLGVADRGQIGRDQHEKFARAFEAYLMEGKAPTRDLQSVMERVKKWMVAIYQQIVNLGVDLNPEIRGVFDRLVAPSQQKTFLQENRNANARTKSGVSSEPGTPQPGTREQTLGDAVSNWRSQNSGIASPEVQRLAGVIREFYPRLENGIMYAIENGADVRIGQDQDGNEVITMGWESVFGREHLFQVTMTPNTPIYIDATVAESSDSSPSFYLHHIEAANRGNRVSPIAYRNIAQVMQATHPEIDTVSGVIVSKGSFLARTPYLSSDFDVVNGSLVTDVRDLAEMNMVPGWDRAIGEKAWAAYEAGNTFLASDFLQSARGENGIVFFQSGLNPFAVVDSALGSAGLTTMRERLGVNGETATAKDYRDALVGAISGLGSSVRETSVKIRNKWKDLPENIIRKIAEFAHTFTTEGKVEGEKPADPKQTLNTYSRAMRAVSPDDLVIEGISNQDASQIIRTMNDGKFRNELWKFSPVRKASMPSQFALRNMERMAPLDRAIQNKVGDRNSFKRIFEAEAKLVTDIEANPEQDKYLGIALALASLPRQDGQIRPWTKEELKQRFPKMHDKTIDAYFKVRDAMRKANNLRVGAITEMTNKLIAKAERTMRKPDTKREVANSLSRNIDKLKAELAEVKSVFKNPEYWPLSRQGKYRWDMYAPGVKEPIGTFFTEHAGNAGRREASQQAALMASLFPEVKKAVDSGSVEWNRDEPLRRPVQLPKVPDSVKNSGGLIMDLSTAAWATTASRISGEIGLKQDLGMLLTLGVNQSYMDQYAKAHEMRREGVPGWSPEAANIFRMTINSWANEFANNRNRSDIEDSILRLTQKEAGRLYDPVLLEEAQAQARWESAPPYSKASNAIATYAFIHSLGGVPVFAVMNGVFQPMTNSIPYFSNIYGSVEATKATAIAQTVAMQFIQWTRLEDFEGMSAADISKMVNDRIGNMLNHRLIGWFAGDEKTTDEIKRHVIAALTSAMTSGVTSPNVAMELTTKSKELGSSRMLSGRVSPEAAAVINKFFKGVAATRDFFMDVWGSMAYKTERINLTRDVIAAAILGAKHGYLNTHDGGTSLEKITEGSEVDPDREWASDIGYRSALATRNTNLAGGRGNVPGYMRIPGMVKPWLTPMLLYKRFMVNTAVTFHTLGVADARNHQIEHGQAPTGKLRAAGIQGVKYAKGHVGNAISTMMLAGPAAYWPIAIAAAVAKAALGDDEWWKFWEQVNADAVEKGMAIVPGDTEDEKRKRAMNLIWNVERGAVNLAGVDAHDSLAAGLFLGKSDSVAEFIGNALLGPLGQPIGGAVDHVAQTGSIEGLGEKIMPRQVKNMDRAQSGNMNFLGGAGPDYTPVERFAKTLSMKPTRESKLQYYQTKKFEVMAIRKEKVKYFNEKMKRVLKDIGGTQSPAFSDAIKAIQAEMNDWNKDKTYWTQRFPGQFRPITIDDIDYLFRPKGRDLDKAKSEMGID